MFPHCEQIDGFSSKLFVVVVHITPSDSDIYKIYKKMLQYIYNTVYTSIKKVRKKKKCQMI